MTGTRKEGVFYGCATFMYKLSQALAVMFVGLMLDAIGFNADLVQPRGVYMKVGLILPIGLLFCFFIAVGFTARYKLNREKVNQYQRCISSGKFAQGPAASPDTLPDCPSYWWLSSRHRNRLRRCSRLFLHWNYHHPRLRPDSG